MLKAHKSSGPDDVRVNVLKNCPAISIPLAMLFNRSFKEGYLPQDWRDANICPIHKNGNRAQAMNLRPVSLTNQVVKLMERLVLDSITSHLVENNITSCEQHGVQRGSSCVTQLLECFDDWLTNLDENLGTDIMYLDFTNAFDCISHTPSTYSLNTMVPRVNYYDGSQHSRATEDKGWYRNTHSPTGNPSYLECLNEPCCLQRCSCSI